MTMLRVAAVLVLTVLVGCDQIDPYRRDGTWRPNGANEANLRAMIVVPSDLAVASHATPTDGTLAAAALSRLHRDRVRPLPDSGLAQVVPVGNGSAAPPPVAAAVGSGQ
jgi:hypothetical protein